MTREEALDSIRANVENENLIRHMLATEAIMRVLAPGRLARPPACRDCRCLHRLSRLRFYLHRRPGST